MMYFNKKKIECHRAIEGLAANTIKQLDLSYPIDVDYLLKKLGGKLCSINPKNHTVIIKRKNNFKISTCEQDRHRLKEVIAKSIFHYLVHMHTDNVYVDAYDRGEGWSRTDNNWRWEDYCAEYYAMCLLMGKDQFYDAVDKLTKDGRFSLVDVAKEFDVSVSLAEKWVITTGIGVVGAPAAGVTK